MESPEHVTARRNEPDLSPLTEEERKARQRVHARRSYYRKLGLRSQVDQLEAQYAELLHQVRLQEACAFVAESEDESELSELPENDSLKSLYADLMDVKDMLRLENEALKGSLALYQKYERQVRQLLPSADANTSSESSEQSDDSSAPQRAPRDPLIVIPSFQKSVTLAFCHQLGEQTFAVVIRFRQNPDFMTTGASIFGWRDRSIRQNGSLHFLLKKTFRHITADEFATRGWDFASKPKNMARICSASLNPRVFEIQRVDENIVCFCVSSRHTAATHR